MLFIVMYLSMAVGFASAFHFSWSENGSLRVESISIFHWLFYFIALYKFYALKLRFYWGYNYVLPILSIIGKNINIFNC